MNKKEVFISLPMNGKTEEEILEDIQKAKKAYLELSGEDIREVAFVNNLERGKRALQAEKEDAEKQGLELILPEPERMGVWYLGIALNNIAYCDMVFFYGDWKNARGCLIEEKVCELYGIPTIKMTEEDDQDSH